MTPPEAAALLGVETGATPSQIEAGYRRRARALHPDLLENATREQLDAATRDFARIADARGLLLAIGSPEAVVLVRRPPGRGALGAWVSLLALTAVVTLIGGDLPWSLVNVVARIVPLSIALVAFALTGRRVYFVLAAIFVAASVVVTLAYASFVPLVTFQLLLVPVLGLWWMGRQRSLS